MADLLSEVLGTSDPNCIYQCFVTRDINDDSFDINISMGFDCLVPYRRVRLWELIIQSRGLGTRSGKHLGLNLRRD